MRMCECGEEDGKVSETRIANGSVLKRRRVCGHCGRRWWTYEISERDWMLLNLPTARYFRFDDESKELVELVNLRGWKVA